MPALAELAHPLAAIRLDAWPTLEGKGDYVGHPFHGNQWTGGAKPTEPHHYHNAYSALSAMYQGQGTYLSPHPLSAKATYDFYRGALGYGHSTALHMAKMSADERVAYHLLRDQYGLTHDQAREVIKGLMYGSGAGTGLQGFPEKLAAYQDAREHGYSTDKSIQLAINPVTLMALKGDYNNTQIDQFKAIADTVSNPNGRLALARFVGQGVTPEELQEAVAKFPPYTSYSANNTYFQSLNVAAKLGEGPESAHTMAMNQMAMNDPEHANQVYALAPQGKEFYDLLKSSGQGAASALAVAQEYQNLSQPERAQYDQGFAQAVNAQSQLQEQDLAAAHEYALANSITANPDFQAQIAQLNPAEQYAYEQLVMENYPKDALEQVQTNIPGLTPAAQDTFIEAMQNGEPMYSAAYDAYNQMSKELVNNDSAVHDAQQLLSENGGLSGKEQYDALKEFQALAPNQQQEYLKQLNDMNGQSYSTGGDAGDFHPVAMEAAKAVAPNATNDYTVSLGVPATVLDPIMGGLSSAQKSQYDSLSMEQKAAYEAIRANDGHHAETGLGAFSHSTAMHLAKMDPYERDAYYLARQTLGASHDVARALIQLTPEQQASVVSAHDAGTGWDKSFEQATVQASVAPASSHDFSNSSAWATWHSDVLAAPGLNALTEEQKNAYAAYRFDEAASPGNGVLNHDFALALAKLSPAQREVYFAKSETQTPNGGMTPQAALAAAQAAPAVSVTSAGIQAAAAAASTGAQVDETLQTKVGPSGLTYSMNPPGPQPNAGKPDATPSPMGHGEYAERFHLNDTQKAQYDDSMKKGFGHLNSLSYALGMYGNPGQRAQLKALAGDDRVEYLYARSLGYDHETAIQYAHTGQLPSPPVQPKWDTPITADPADHAARLAQLDEKFGSYSAKQVASHIKALDNKLSSVKAKLYSYGGGGYTNPTVQNVVNTDAWRQQMQDYSNLAEWDARHRQALGLEGPKINPDGTVKWWRYYSQTGPQSNAAQTVATGKVQHTVSGSWKSGIWSGNVKLQMDVPWSHVIAHNKAFNYLHASEMEMTVAAGAPVTNIKITAGHVHGLVTGQIAHPKAYPGSDNLALEDWDTKDWDETQHPRRADGRFLGKDDVEEPAYPAGQPKFSAADMARVPANMRSQGQRRAFIQGHAHPLAMTLSHVQDQLKRAGFNVDDPNDPRYVKIDSRIKNEYSLTEKLIRQDKLREAGKRIGEGLPTDVAAFRLTAGNRSLQQELADLLDKGRFGQLNTSDQTGKRDFEDYLNNPKDGYRAVHGVLRGPITGGAAVEVQIRTPRQTQVADWSHDTVYKGELKKDPAAQAYALHVWNEADRRDRGLPAQPLPLPPGKVPLLDLKQTPGWEAKWISWMTEGKGDVPGHAFHGNQHISLESVNRELTKRRADLQWVQTTGSAPVTTRQILEDIDRLLKQRDQLRGMKGDRVGHEFHGNQWTGGGLPSTFGQLQTLERVSGPHGSQPGKWYQDPNTGAKFYVKRQKSEAHAANEVLGAAVYYAAGARPGVDFPKVGIVAGPTGVRDGIISEKIKGLGEKETTWWNGPGKATADQAAKLWGIDALTSHWDVVGASNDNLLVHGETGTPVRVEAGGSLNYRAMGESKGSGFSENGPWHEPWTMRGVDHEGAHGSTQSKRIFGQMSDEQVIEGLKTAQNLNLDHVRDWAARMGVQSKYVEPALKVLAARQARIPQVIAELQSGKAALLWDLKGDYAGHLFHGNQFAHFASDFWSHAQGQGSPKTPDTPKPNMPRMHGQTDLMRHLLEHHGFAVGRNPHFSLLKQAHELAHSPQWLPDHDHPKGVDEFEVKGDKPGHEFHGNQWTNGGHAELMQQMPWSQRNQVYNLYGSHRTAYLEYRGRGFAHSTAMHMARMSDSQRTLYHSLRDQAGLSHDNARAVLQQGYSNATRIGNYLAWRAAGVSDQAARDNMAHNPPALTGAQPDINPDAEHPSLTDAQEHQYSGLSAQGQLAYNHYVSEEGYAHSTAMHLGRMTELQRAGYERLRATPDENGLLQSPLSHDRAREVLGSPGTPDNVLNARVDAYLAQRQTGAGTVTHDEALKALDNIQLQPGGIPGTHVQVTLDPEQLAGLHAIAGQGPIKEDMLKGILGRAQAFYSQPQTEVIKNPTPEQRAKMATDVQAVQAALHAGAGHFGAAGASLSNAVGFLASGVHSTPVAAAFNKGHFVASVTWIDQAETSYYRQSLIENGLQASGPGVHIGVLGSDQLVYKTPGAAVAVQLEVVRHMVNNNLNWLQSSYVTGDGGVAKDFHKSMGRLVTSSGYSMWDQPRRDQLYALQKLIRRSHGKAAAYDPKVGETLTIPLEGMDSTFLAPLVDRVYELLDQGLSPDEAGKQAAAELLADEPEDEPVSQADRDLVEKAVNHVEGKGDVVGHPFHGNQYDGSRAGYATTEEFSRAQELAKAKVLAAPKPTKRDIQHNNALVAHSNRAGGDMRGNSHDRAARTAHLLKDFGDSEHCPCVYCGVKLDASTLTADKIYTESQGGRYKYNNVLPACLSCNEHRNDEAIAA